MFLIIIKNYILIKNAAGYIDFYYFDNTRLRNFVITVADTSAVTPVSLLSRFPGMIRKFFCGFFTLALLC